MQVAPSRARFPGGESIREMQARMVGALDDVVAAHPHETVVVVSHADPIKSAIAHYTGMHLDLFQRVHVSPGVGDGVRLPRRTACMLVKCNDTGGLDDLLPEPRARSEGGRRRDRSHRVRSRRRHRRRRVRSARRAHVRDPGPQGRRACCRCSSRRNRSRCSRPRPSSSSTASPRRIPRSRPTFGRVDDGGAVEEDEPLFRARLIGIGYDPERQLVLIELREEAADERRAAAAARRERRPHRAAYATRAQIRAMVANGVVAVDGGPAEVPAVRLPDGSRRAHLPALELTA